MPWNVALWYAFGRLRLAIEADCDRRVLAAHPDVRAYGSLLVDVSERTLAGAAPLAALAESATHLARRIHLMTARRPRRAPLRVAAASLGSLACLALALEAPRPALAQSSRIDSAGNVRLYTALQAALRVMQDSTSTPNRAELYRRLSLAAIAADSTLSDIPDSTVRRVIAERYPTSLTGGLGARPMIWVLADEHDSVLGTATGRDGLAGGDAVTWTAAGKRFSALPASMGPGELMARKHFAAPRGGVDVVWVRS